MIVEEIIQTCSACPSQWEGNLKDGRMFYARYRWGRLTIELSKAPTTDVFKAMCEDADLIYNKNLGDEYDGVLDTNELKGIMKHLGFIYSD